MSDDQVSAGPRSDETDGTTVGRPDVEPFVHREPVVGPPPVRKMISEQLQEEELVAQQQEEELAEARSEVVIGIEGIEAVPGPSDALPGEDPEVVAVVEEAAEPEADPAGALKIVESLTEAVAPEKVDSSQQDSTVEEVEIPEEIPEESPDEVAREVAHTETTATSEIGFAALPSESREEAIDQIEEIVDEVVDEAVAEAVVEQAPEVAEPQVEVLQSEVQEVVEVEEVELATSPEAPVLVAETGSERPRRRLTARLGTLLLDAHLISGRDLDRALEEHQVSGERLGHYLVDKGMVDEKDLAAVLSDQYGVPAADVETAAVPAAALMCVPEKMARRYMVLPLGVNEGTIDLAMVNPSDIDAIKDIEFTTGLRVQPLIATDWAIERAIERLYSGEELRTARLSGGSSSSTGLKDPKAIIRRMVRDRDEAVLQSEQDPQSAYELAASIDEFVDEILKVVKQLQK